MTTHALQKRYILRKIWMTIIQNFMFGMLGLGLANVIFKDTTYGFIGFQIFGAIGVAFSYCFTTWLTKTPTRQLELQLKFLKNYNTFKFVYILVSIVSTTIMVYTGPEGWLWIALASLPLTIVVNALNMIEGSCETVILSSANKEISNFYDQKFGKFQQLFSALGQASALLLPVFGMKEFPFTFCIIVLVVRDIIDVTEISYYVNKTKEEVVEYIETSISSVKQLLPTKK